MRPVVVVEFLHQGLIRLDKDAPAADGFPACNVVVVSENGRLTACRVLQLGPGDFCRLAFQAIAGQNSYDIFYGGPRPEARLLPRWTNGDGLLLETRRFAQCDLRDLDSLRTAYKKAEPLGADYVEGVFHAHNPTRLAPGPFFSRYSGKMHLDDGGDYTFWTSSRDCSFVVIDGKLVVAAPGRHGPQWRARPELGKTVRLSAGKHKFEYFHAAAGDASMMSLSWLKGPAGKKPRPETLPPSVFRAGSIARAEASSPSTQARKMAPDFRFEIAGEVPLPGEPLAMVGVSFQNASPPGLSANSKFHWDFGDGQASSLINPAHVYLCPGLYTVSLSIKRGSRLLTATNRIYVGRPLRTRRSKEEPHKLDDYLPIISTYDPEKLDAISTRQLFLAFKWKADSLKSEKAKNDEKETPDPQKMLAAAVEAAHKSLARKTVTNADTDLLSLAMLATETATNQLNDSDKAFTIWLDTAKQIKNRRHQAICNLAAADIAVNELLRLEAAKPLLDSAAAVLKNDSDSKTVSRLKRVWGDYYASRGNGEAARKAYLAAQTCLKDARSHAKMIAWRGAHSRSAEDYIKCGKQTLAIEELQRWQASFPADKIDGHITYLWASCQKGRKHYKQAVALCEQLAAVNPDSPHVDRMLLLAAGCELDLSRPMRAKALLRSILTDCPGSPLVETVKKKLSELEKGK